jgi:hypothetical protein
LGSTHHAPKSFTYYFPADHRTDDKVAIGVTLDTGITKTVYVKSIISSTIEYHSFSCCACCLSFDFTVLENSTRFEM